MSRADKTSNSAGGARPHTALLWMWGNRHFMAASLILLVTAAGWGAARAFLGVVFQKEPVPWPEGVRVDQDHRLLSLPKAFGPGGRYRMVEGDGVLWKKRNGEPDLDGLPDGERVHRQDLLDSLSIATKFDRTRYDSRRSNWYVSRIYEDKDARSGYRLWHLDVTYYTGGLDKVPHVGERCIVAAGGTLLRPSKTVRMEIPAGPKGWTGKVPFSRTLYLAKAGRFGATKHLQYHTFSLNGRPEADWQMVRLKLQNPFERYGYFAKIQFGPRGPVRSTAEPEQAAQAFIQQALPEVLKTLPTPEDIERIDD